MLFDNNSKFGSLVKIKKLLQVTLDKIALQVS